MKSNNILYNSWFKNYALLLFAFPICLLGQSLPKPIFSSQAGFYADSLKLSILSSISGAQIRYTLNGEEPTINSTLYNGTITLKNRSHSKNNISTIPTNPSFSYPKPGYDTSRADSRGWLAPYDTVFKATVVKAKLFKSGFPSDSTRVSTFLIKEGTSTMFTLPILSISLDSATLFSYNSGIYVYGIDSIHEGNYMNDTAVRKAYLEYFENNGNQAFSQYGTIAIHGNGGRHAPQKSLILNAEKSFGKGTFSFKIFEGSEMKKFDKLLLRNSGHRPDCMPRDDIGQLFLKSLSNISQNNKHCIVLINGEYWGIQTLKEIIDNNYFYRKFNMPKANCVILTQAGSLDEGSPGDEVPYSDLLNFLTFNNLNTPSNYNYVNTQMDIESFTDFECAEIFLGNGDWPNNNTKFWRYKRAVNDLLLNNNLDGRWRWLIYDLDAAFGGDCGGIYPSHNSLLRATDPIYNNFTKPLRGLLTNNQYKIDFINRYADLLNSNFLSSQLVNSINSITMLLNPEIQEHVERWRYPAVANTLQNRALEIPSNTKWNTISTNLIKFSNLRASKTQRHFMNYFLLQDTVKVTLDVNDTVMGKIKINSLNLDQYLIRNKTKVYPWTGTYFNGNPITINAIAYPGYKFLHWNNINDTLPYITSNVSKDTSVIAYFVIDTAFKAAHYLYINEVLTSNNTNIKDDYFQNEDWIELYNPNNYSVDVSGYYISNNSNTKLKFKINGSTKQTIIPAHQFKLIYADNDTLQGVFHANFKLNNASSFVYLTLPNGIGLVDSVVITNQTTDISYGREHDGAQNWISFSVPTPNSTNKKAVIDTEIEPDYFLIYPNPASTTLYFTQTSNITICDVLGKKITDFQNVKFIDISSLAQGVYILKVENGKILKFIKQ